MSDIVQFCSNAKNFLYVSLNVIYTYLAHHMYFCKKKKNTYIYSVICVWPHISGIYLLVVPVALGNYSLALDSGVPLGGIQGTLRCQDKPRSFLMALCSEKTFDMFFS